MLEAVPPPRSSKVLLGLAFLVSLLLAGHPSNLTETAEAAAPSWASAPSSPVATWDLFEITEAAPKPPDDPTIPTPDPPGPTPDHSAPTPDKAPSPPVASNRFSLGKPKPNRRLGIVRLPVTVPGPGTLALSGKGIVEQRTTPTAAGTENLLVKAKGRAKKLLATGRAIVNVKVTYAPAGGTANSMNRTLILKRAPTTPRHRRTSDRHGTARPAWATAKATKHDGRSESDLRRSG